MTKNIQISAHNKIPEIKIPENFEGIKTIEEFIEAGWGNSPILYKNILQILSWLTKELTDRGKGITAVEFLYHLYYEETLKPSELLTSVNHHTEYTDWRNLVNAIESVLWWNRNTLHQEQTTKKELEKMKEKRVLEVMRILQSWQISEKSSADITNCISTTKSNAQAVLSILKIRWYLKEENEVDTLWALIDDHWSNIVAIAINRIVTSENNWNRIPFQRAALESLDTRWISILKGIWDTWWKEVFIAEVISWKSMSAAFSNSAIKTYEMIKNNSKNPSCNEEEAENYVTHLELLKKFLLKKDGSFIWAIDFKERLTKKLPLNPTTYSEILNTLGFSEKEWNIIQRHLRANSTYWKKSIS